MRLSTLLLAAVPVTAIPFTGPNYLPQFPAPTINQTFELDLTAMQEQNPTWQVFFEGGLVGLYGHRQGEVIWTTPWTPWQEREEPERVYSPPIPGCGRPCFPVVPPPVQEPDNPVPEPSGWLMLAIGLAAIWLRRMGR